MLTKIEVEAMQSQMNFYKHLLQAKDEELLEMKRHNQEQERILNDIMEILNCRLGT